MSSRVILLAVLATTALLAGSVGVVAASGSYAAAQGDSADEPADDGLPRTLPEAVGHGLTLLDHVSDTLPASADDVAEVL